tara:strand:- start:69 stop:929 length:861 start_codon:yes stop_codon:yes gene_type:complete
MGYLPKSKFQKLFTSGDEFVDARTKLIYKGPYIQTSTGAYAGHNASQLKTLLARISWTDLTTDETESEGKMVVSADSQVYQRISKKDKFIRGTERIIATKTKPTKKDYKKGRYIRFFAKKNNSILKYIEISEKTYKAIRSRNKKYDYYLYTAGAIDWALEGDVVKVNKNLLLLKSKEFPNISQLFPKLNEYQKLLYSNGSELVYRDNPSRKYVGYYHIHPDKGPMEGSVHKSIPHARLMFITNSIIQDKETPSFTYTPPSNIQSRITPYGTSGDIDDSSSGGGGGY